ncbi:MAG: hypothetical protein O3B05_00170 [archaeon]|nr:hypothetical protein [archaeon]
MRRASLALLLVLTLSLAGCLAPTSASWDGDGVVVQQDGMTATVTTGMTGSQTEFSDVELAGCAMDGTIGTADNQTRHVVFEGHLAASTLYDSHTTDVRGLSLASTGAVIIEAMTYDAAAEVANGAGARIPVNDWSEPLYPETSSGQSTTLSRVDIDSVDTDDDDEWYVLALIPGTENIASGMASLAEVHRPVRIEGYLVQSVPGTSGGLLGGASNAQSGRTACVVDVPSNNRADHFLVVQRIEYESSTVSANGDADDEWVMGQVPLLGRGGYVVFLLAVGGGGSAAMYLVSAGRVRAGATASARVLLGEANISKAKEVDRTAKRASTPPGPSKASSSKPKPKPSPAPQESSIGGFDIDAALSSKGSSPGSGAPVGGAPRSGSSSVVATSNVAAAPTSTGAAPSTVPRGGVTSGGVTPVGGVTSGGVTPVGGGSTAPTPTSSASQAPWDEKPEPITAPAPVRRRAAKKPAPAPEPAHEPEPEPERATYEEPDEDFADFSF